MNVEQILTDELQVVATAVDAPAPPAPADLVRLARREQRTHTMRRRGLAVGLTAAAVVAAILLGSEVGRPDAAPSPTEPASTATAGPLPTGAPPRIPYVVGPTLYLAPGVRADGDWWEVTTKGEYSVAVRPGGKMHRGRPVLFRNGTATDLLKDAQVDAIFSPSGRKLAWMEQSGGSAHLVVYDLVDDRVQGQLPIDPDVVATDNEAEENVFRLDDSGTVTYGGLLGWHTWTPGRAPTTTTPPDRDGRADGLPARASEVTLSPDGSWAAWLTDHDGHQPPVDQTDWNGVTDAVTFQVPHDAGSRFTLALPAVASYVAWESATDVLVAVPDDPDGDSWHFLRCDVLGRRCERAPTD